MIPRRSKLLRTCTTVVVLSLASGCGSADGSDAQSAGAPGPGGGLTVEEALKSKAEGPLLVRGTLIVRGEEARLCSAILESHPPQCGEPSLRVAGLGAEGVSGMEQAKGTAWTPREVALLGEIDAGTLTVSATASG